MSKKQHELELWTRYKNDGDKQAKVELIGSLKPLIMGQVNKFRASGLPATALELEGMRIASGAIDTYDPNKAQMNTHLTNSLKKLSRYVINYQNIGHIPEPRALMIGKYNTIKENLSEELGREPSILELSDSMQVAPIEIERLQTELRKDLTIDLPSAEEDEGGFYMYTQEDEINPRLTQAIEFVYFDSDPIDKKILEYTFGLGGIKKKKFVEIAKELRLSDSVLKRRKKLLAKEIKELL